MSDKAYQRSQETLRMLTELRDVYRVPVRRIAKAASASNHTVEAWLKNSNARRSIRKNQFNAIEALYRQHEKKIVEKASTREEEPMQVVTDDAPNVEPPLGIPTIVKRAFECVRYEDAEPVIAEVRFCQRRMGISEIALGELIGICSKSLGRAFDGGDSQVDVYRKMADALPGLRSLAEEADKDPGAFAFKRREIDRPWIQPKSEPTKQTEEAAALADEIRKESMEISRQRTLELAEKARAEGVDADHLEEAMGAEQHPKLPEGFYVRIHEFLEAKCWECGEPAHMSQNNRKLPVMCAYCGGKVKIHATVKGWFDSNQIEESE
jgi:DNA-directed RNA polymerase subunit RPC12/RpoP